MVNDTFQYVIILLILALCIAYVAIRVRKLWIASKQKNAKCIGCPLADACNKHKSEGCREKK